MHLQRNGLRLGQAARAACTDDTHADTVVIFTEQR